jgi:hypothetical protein
MELLKWLMSLKTPQQKLTAALFGAVIVLGTVVGLLFKELQGAKDQDKQETERVIAACEVRVKALTQQIEQERQRTDEARRATATAERRYTDFVVSLWSEQKNINQKAHIVDKTQRELAAENRRHLKDLENDTKVLMEYLNKKK